MLLGRDLSMGGMRVEAEPTLCVNDEIRLALQPQGADDPILLEATIVRDDHEGGLALRFDYVDPQSEPRWRS